MDGLYALAKGMGGYLYVEIVGSERRRKACSRGIHVVEPLAR